MHGKLRPEKNHSPLSKQLKKYCHKIQHSKTFRAAKIKLKVINKCRVVNKTFIAIMKSLNLVKTTYKYSQKLTISESFRTVKIKL